MPETLFAATTEVTDLPLDWLTLPDNNVGPVDQDAVDQLEQSIAELGVLQPIVVVGDGEQFEIVLGRHRYLASQQAGLTTIPAIVRTFDTDLEQQLAMLVENLHRRTIDPIAEGQAYARLVKAGVKQRDLADKVGRSQSHVSKRVALTKLPESVQTAVLDGRLGVGQAEDLAKVRDRKAIEKMVANGRRPAEWEVGQLVRKQERDDRLAAFRKECADEGLIELEGHTWYSEYRSVDDDETATHFFAGNMLKLVAKNAAVAGDGPVATVGDTSSLPTATGAAEHTARVEAERKESQRRSDLWTAVRADHSRHIGEMFAGKGVKFDAKLAQEHTNRWLITTATRWQMSDMVETACRMLDLTIDPDGESSDQCVGGAELEAFANATPTAHIKAALAVALADAEEPVRHMASRPNGFGLDPLVTGYYRWLEASGYVVGADERAELDRISTPVDDEDVA